jgi:5'(3')-deoxyribonucleotidase
MSKPRFLIDADEVLINFVDPAIEVISQVLGRPWSLDEAPSDTWDMFGGLPEDVQREVDRIIDTPGWCSELEPYPGAQDAVRELEKRCEVLVLTSPRRKARQWVYERNLALLHYFGIRRERIIQTAAKYVCAAMFYLDDNPDHVTAWQAEPYNAESIGMFWSTKHNARLTEYDDIRVRSWSEVLGVVNFRLGF